MKWRVVVLFASIFWAGCIESRSSAKDPSEDTDTGTIDMATTQADGGGAADLGLDRDAETTGVCETTDDCEAGAQCVEGQCTEPECRGDDQCANVVQGCVEAFVETDAWDRAHAYVAVNVRMVFAYHPSVNQMTNATANNIAGEGTASS